MSKPLPLALAALSVFFSFGGAAIAAVIPPGTVLHDKQELVRNSGSEPETLDPAVAESVGANTIMRDLFESLTTTDNESKLMPGVAESWKQTNPTTWVFTLRKTAVFSNGTPITADDFVYAWRRFMDPKTASQYSATYGMFIVNGKEIAKGEKPGTDLGVKALDKYTLEVKTTGPVAFMPELMSNTQFAPLSKAAIDKFGKDWTKPANMVSNGAFTLKDWKVNSKVILEKSAKYWDAKNVQLTKVTYLPVEDGNADVKLFQSGENDWVYQLPPGTFEQMRASNPKDIRNSPMLGIRYYAFQNQDPLLKDVRIRKAMSLVIDRDILAKKVTADGQIPSYGLAVKGLYGADVTTYDWATWPMDKKVAEAKKLLAEAGVKPGTKLKFAYNTSEYHKKMAIFAASEWKTKLGLDVEMDNMEFKVLLKKRHDGDFQIARNGWIADYNDATTFYALVQCGGDQNDNKNCNPKADELAKQAGQQSDPVKRKELLTQAFKLVMDDYPLLPLVQYTLPRLVKSYVGGYSELNLLDRFSSKHLYIIKH